MQQKKPQIWYASSLRPYAENEPWLYDTKNYQPLTDIENQWAGLKEEIQNLIKEKDKGFASSKSVYENIDVNNGWSAITFLFWGAKISGEFKKKCPKTTVCLKKIPGLVSLSISQLAPKSEIGEHEGDTNGILRCHLGIDIPASLPDCGLKVNSEQRNWEEGKWIIFNDAYKHSAWNHTDKRRIIIIMDFIKPEFIHKKNMICAFIITRHVSYIYDKIRLIRVMPVFIKTILFAGILGLVYLFKPIYNLFKA